MCKAEKIPDLFRSEFGDLMDFASLRKRLLNPAEHPHAPRRSCHEWRFEYGYWALSSMLTTEVRAAGWLAPRA